MGLDAGQIWLWAFHVLRKTRNSFAPVRSWLHQGRFSPERVPDGIGQGFGALSEKKS